MDSKTLGYSSLGLSYLSLMLLFTLRVLPGIVLVTLLVVLLADLACSVLAARRGSKLWLLASTWPLYCLGALILR